LTWHSAAGLDALPVARLHPLVRDTSRPAPGPDLLAFTELAARLLKAAAEAAGETGDPRGPAGVVGLAEVFTARLRGLVPDHPDTRRTARQIDFLAERQA